MPCMCWFTPEEKDKQEIKMLCQQIVDKSIALEKIGDPIGLEWSDIITLLNHLRYPETCKENPNYEKE